MSLTDSKVGIIIMIIGK